jgi:hypothetical protein
MADEQTQVQPEEQPAPAALPELPPNTVLHTLHSAGAIPGIGGGEHGVGTYLVNLVERTSKRLEDWLVELEEARKAKEAEKQAEATASKAAPTPASKKAAPAPKEDAPATEA